MKAFWQQSVLRGCLARAFTEVAVPACAEEAFLFGLLQDCGILLLVQFLGKPYAELCQARLSPATFFAAEKRRFRYDHVQTICALAREWDGPPWGMGGLSTPGLFAATGPARSERKVQNIFGLG